MRRVDRAGLQAPALVAQVDPVGHPDRSFDVAGFNSLYCVTRIGSRMQGLSFWDVTGEEWVQAGDLLARDLCAPEPDRISADSVDAIDMCIVICTRDRSAGLQRTLESLVHQTDTNFDILVVDSASSTSEAEMVVAKWSHLPISYVREERPGLSRARNRGLREATCSHILWLDDDELADTYLVAEVKKGFVHPSAPTAVCGLMLPAELETEAQVRFEQFDGFNKGRGLRPRSLRLGDRHLRSPLYPLPGFGAGGNMAFAVSALREVGGFDENLGVGTPTGGGEETRVLSALLRNGKSVLHWPSAVTWHFHRREMSALVRQMEGYGAGLTAFYASSVFDDPMVLAEVVRLIPQGLRDIRSSSSTSSFDPLPGDFPPELTRASRRGLLLGVMHYSRGHLRDRLRARRPSCSDQPGVTGGDITVGRRRQKS
jgi:glycosyltransferase involved in cell wall biosynthesis